MSARLKQAISWIATILAFAVGTLVLAASIVALALFVFVVHHLISQVWNRELVLTRGCRAFCCHPWRHLADGQFVAGHHRCERFSPLRNKAESAHPDRFALADRGSGDWSALLFVWRVARFPRLIGAVADPQFEQHPRQQQLADEKYDGGSDHIDNGQRQEKPARQQGKQDSGI